jgi:hypothetical protein
MEKPLNIKQIQQGWLVFALVSLLALLLITTQVVVSMQAGKVLNKKVSTYSETTTP